MLPYKAKNMSKWLVTFILLDAKINTHYFSKTRVLKHADWPLASILLQRRQSAWAKNRRLAIVVHVCMHAKVARQKADIYEFGSCCCLFAWFQPSNCGSSPEKCKKAPPETLTATYYNVFWETLFFTCVSEGTLHIRFVSFASPCLTLLQLQHSTSISWFLDWNIELHYQILQAIGTSWCQYFVYPCRRLFLWTCLLKYNMGKNFSLHGDDNEWLW